MKFRTQYEKQTNKPTPCGNKIEQDYELRLTANGSKKLVPKGKRNIYEKIQAHKDETDIYKIIELHDPNIAKQIMDKKAIEAMYKNENDVYDLRDTPNDLVQAKQMLNDAQKKFEALPTAIKKEFNNNMYEFLKVAKDQNEMTERLKKFAPKQPKVENIPQQTTPTNTTTTNTNTTTTNTTPSEGGAF